MRIILYVLAAIGLVTLVAVVIGYLVVILSIWINYPT